MQMTSVLIENPDGLNVILGQSHFIKTVEDIHEAMVNSVPGAKFAVAFCEASEPALVRASGTDEELLALAKRNALTISAGHSFIVFMRDCFPINVLNAIKSVPEVCGIYAATANPLKVLVVDDEQGRGIIGVIDGIRSKGVESPEDVAKRQALLRRFGYKV